MDKDSSAASKYAVKLTRKQLIIVLLMFASLLIGVGLLSGLIKPSCTSLLVAQPAAQSLADAKPWLNARLARHVVPVHYDLSLFPDFYRPDEDDARFYGNVSILINVTEKPTRYLIVHADELAIRDTRVHMHRSGKTR